MSEQRFQVGERVRFVGHIMHKAPPILAGKTGQEGTVEDGGYGDLYRVELDVLFGNKAVPTTVQVHSDQLALP